MTQLSEKIQQTGQWLFRWRSFLPLFVIPLFLIALKGRTYRPDDHLLNALWEIMCFVISFLGFGIRVYTIGHVPECTSGRNTHRQKANSLNTTGAYSVVRHPLYIGNFLIWFGVVLFVRSLFFSIVAVLLFFLYYRLIIFAEEEFLREKFGQAFDEWAAKTPAIFPRFTNWKSPALPFSLRMVLKREYSAFFFIAISFTCLEVLGDFFYEGKWHIGWPYILILLVGAVAYVSLRALKKRHRLDIEGR